VRFGLDGAEYEIDLSARNATAFREQLAPFTRRARKASRAPGSRPGRSASARERSSGIRAWARSGHRRQRPRQDPRQRDRAVPSRRQKSLTRLRSRPVRADGPRSVAHSPRQAGGVYRAALVRCPLSHSAEARYCRVADVLSPALKAHRTPNRAAQRGTGRSSGRTQIGQFRALSAWRADRRLSWPWQTSRRAGMRGLLPVTSLEWAGEAAFG
jgi:hypothetical protein